MRSRTRLRLWLVTAVTGVAWSLAQLGGVANALPPYPDPPPDLAHPGTFHDTPYRANDPVYSSLGGERDREMLVVLTQFTDVANDPNATEAWAARRFFGAFPSAADYFRVTSHNDMILTPAAEDSGTANNGVVTVNAGTFASFTSLGDAQRMRRLMELANPAVNYATFDDNNDGRIDDLELIVVNIRTANPVADDPATPADETNTDSCASNRGIAGPASFDGKNMEGTLNPSEGTTGTNLITFIHEIGHQATHMRDLYGFGVGSWALSGPTCGAPESYLFGPTGWEKLHFGWGTPTVVVQDGYYDVPNVYTSGRYFMLYDPSKGTEDFFVVENRQRTASTYDQSAHDSGLAIWRSDDNVWESSTEATRPIDIMRPDGTTTDGCGAGGCYGGSPRDAWDPSDPSTPQRTMSRTWRDGTASNVAVRSIGRSGETIRAYFDVRGPGVLVDALDAQARTQTVQVKPTDANPLSFTVMNTGEATDTFAFTLQGLPPGWTASTDTKSLAAGAGSTANITVTPAADALTGIYDLEVVGRSTTASNISSTSPIRLDVILDRTQIDYTGATSRPWGEGAGFSATVRNVDDGLAPVANAPVTFRLGDGTNTQQVTVNSDASGIATAAPALSLAPGTYELRVSTPRVGKHDAASTTTSYTVERRPTVVTYTGDATEEYSDSADVSATLTDGLSGAALEGKTVGFGLGAQSANASSDATGAAATTIVVDQPAQVTTVTAGFAGDALYLPSSDSKAFTIDKEDLTFAYDGDTLVSMSVTPTLSAQATQEGDGFPGDLTRAVARFDLTPTLQPAPAAYAAPVDSAGAAATPATGLPVDLWTIDVSVPAANEYWEGASTSATELVVFDPTAQVTGGAKGPDRAGNATQLELTAQYDKAEQPAGQLQLRTSRGRFKGSAYDWIVRVGNMAIVQLEGQLDLTPAALRLTLADLGQGGAAEPDEYRGKLTDLLGTFDSGRVVATGGNLQVR